MKQEMRGGLLILSFDPVKGVFHKSRCQEEENLQMIKDAASEVMGSPVDVDCVFIDGVMEKDPVDKAIEIFGRDIVKLI